MYSYVNARMKARGKNTQYVFVDISLMTMKTIFADYADGYIKLTNPALSTPVYMNLRTLKQSSIKINFGVSFTAWLGSLGNIVLPASTNEPTYATSRVLYSDAIKARYNIDRVHPTAPPGNPYPLGDLRDLRITKGGVIDSMLYNNAMFTVNGLFHFPDLTIYGTKIKEGGRTVDVANNNSVGILSFRNIGTVQHIAVDSSMIDKPSNLFQSQHSFWLHTGVNFTNKTPVLVLGGYMHITDDVFDIINPELGIIQINFSKINFLQRYFESKRLIDLSSLELSVASYNDELVTLSELYSDAVIARYIDLSQTFVVLVNKPSLFVSEHVLSKTGITGVYMTGQYPQYPMRTTYGACPEFWYRKEYDQWILSIAGGLAPNYLFETAPWRDELATDNVLDNADPYDFAIAHMLEIGYQHVTP